MIRTCAFFLLLLVPCFVRSSKDLDSVIEDLQNRNEVLQDSVGYLMGQMKKMNKQLDELSSASSKAANETYMARLMDSLNLSKQQMSELMNWKKDVDDKLRKAKGSMDKTTLDKTLEPVNAEIKKIEKDLAAVSQKEGAVEKAMKKQIKQMSFLAEEIKKKEGAVEKAVSFLANDIKKNIGNLTDRTQLLANQVEQNRHMIMKIVKKNP